MKLTFPGIIYFNGKQKDNVLKKRNKQRKNRAKQNKTKSAIVGFPLDSTFY